ncbi:MAG: response regulator [Pseudomonadota bacterium]|nr:response regulator [Pseudomonadota bacterium]
MLATEYLEEAGFSADWAGSALEAMNKIGHVPGGVEATVIHIGLPDRQGDALIRELKSLYPTLPIVLATGQDTTELARTLEKIAFVTKPSTATDLLNDLDSLGICGNAERSITPPWQ